MEKNIQNNSPETIIIKEFQPSHKIAVGNLIVEIQREEFQIPITIEQQPDLTNIKDYYQKGNGNFWVASIEDKIVGTISLLDIGNNQVALRKMFVAKDFRGKEFGTAKKLLDCAISHAKSAGVREIYLGTTDKFLAAHRLYEKNGFVEITKNDLPVKFPIMVVDSKFYMLSL